MRLRAKSIESHKNMFRDLIGILVVVMIVLIGGLAVMAWANDRANDRAASYLDQYLKLRQEAVTRGYAEYNQTNGLWHWKDNQ